MNEVRKHTKKVCFKKRWGISLSFLSVTVMLLSQTVPSVIKTGRPSPERIGDLTDREIGVTELRGVAVDADMVYVVTSPCAVDEDPPDGWYEPVDCVFKFSHDGHDNWSRMAWWKLEIGGEGGDYAHPDPQDIAADSQGNVYVAYRGQWMSDGIQKCTVYKEDCSIWKETAGAGPCGVTVDSEGNVWVANEDTASITKFTSDGTLTDEYTVHTRPQDVAVSDVSGEVYVALQNGDVQVLDLNGTPLRDWNAAPWARGIAVDPWVNVYVADISNGVKKFAWDGTEWIAWSDQFSFPHSVAVDRLLNIYVADDDSVDVYKQDDPDDTCKYPMTAIEATDELTGNKLDFAGDEDWIEIAVPGRGWLNVCIHWSEPFPDYDLELWNGDCSAMLVRDDRVGGAWACVRWFGEPGIYKARVLGHGVNDYGAEYRLLPRFSLIELASLIATAYDDYTLVEWETASEVDNAGFNLHRATAGDGPYTKLNDALIPAEGDPESGASYTYTDTDVVKGVTYYYKLEDVDIHGASTFHGPVSAKVQPRFRRPPYRPTLPGF